MPNSQLTTCLEIIKRLRENGPQTPDQIALLTNPTDPSTKKWFDFLAQQAIIERRDGDTYAVGESGINILDFFKF
jgi:hypothetical protein